MKLDEVLPLNKMGNLKLSLLFFYIVALFGGCFLTFFINGWLGMIYLFLALNFAMDLRYYDQKRNIIRAINKIGRRIDQLEEFVDSGILEDSHTTIDELKIALKKR